MGFVVISAVYLNSPRSGLRYRDLVSRDSHLILVLQPSNVQIVVTAFLPKSLPYQPSPSLTDTCLYQDGHTRLPHQLQSATASLPLALAIC